MPRLRPTFRRPSGRVLAIAAAVGVLAIGGTAVGVVAASAAQSSTPAAASTPSTTPAAPRAVDTSGFPTNGGGIFTDRCTETRTAADDPVKMPGMPGMSMVHDFYGNTAPTASSTPASLLGGSTGCSTSADASAYWVPQLYQARRPLTASSTLLYWRAAQHVAASVQTIPAGLTMIAGNESGTTPAGTQTIAWTCADFPVATGEGALTPSPHPCSTGHDLREIVFFPTCWDGRTLDGRSQQNVVDAAAGGACPASHPVRLPQIVLHLNFPTTSDADLTLSVSPTQQGSVTTAHADFMDGWAQSAFTADVSACVAAHVRCGGVTGPDATPHGPTASAEKQADRAHARQQQRAAMRRRAAMRA